MPAAVMHPGHIVASVVVEGQGGGLVTHELSRRVRPGLPGALLTNECITRRSRPQSIYIFHIVLPSVSELWTEDSLEAAPLPRALAHLHDSLLEREHLGSLGAVKGVHALESSSWVLSLPTGMLGGSGKRLCRPIDVSERYQSWCKAERRLTSQ